MAKTWEINSNSKATRFLIGSLVFIVLAPFVCIAIFIVMWSATCSFRSEQVGGSAVRTQLHFNRNNAIGAIAFDDKSANLYIGMRGRRGFDDEPIDERYDVLVLDKEDGWSVSRKIGSLGNSISSLTLSNSDPLRLYASSISGEVAVWDCESPTPLFGVQYPSPVYCVDVSPTGSNVLISTHGQHFILPGNLQPKLRSKELLGAGGLWLNSNQIITYGGYLWDLDSNYTQTLNCGFIEAFVKADDGVILSGRNGLLRISGEREYELLLAYNVKATGFESPVSLAYSSNLQLLFMGYANYRIDLMDLESHHVLESIRLVGEDGENFNSMPYYDTFWIAVKDNRLFAVVEMTKVVSVHLDRIESLQLHREPSRRNP